jgi:hypothetical protein
MPTFNTQPSATMRATVLVVGLMMTSLCLGGVALRFTWDDPEQILVAQTITPAHG